MIVTSVSRGGGGVLVSSYLHLIFVENTQLYDTVLQNPTDILK